MKKMILISMCLSAIFTATLLRGAEEDIIHPKIKLLDKAGRSAAGRYASISGKTSCRPCHDTAFINDHNDHVNKTVKADCITCHFRDAKMAGPPSKAHLRIQLPENSNCAACHGIIHACEEPVRLPKDYEEAVQYKKGGRTYGITQLTGEILAAQDVAHSYMNIKNKGQKLFPWDVHMRRQLTCVSCHFTSNDPRRCANIKSDLDHLKRDPRKIKAHRDYLKWPNHNLATADCTCCHDPFRVHKDFPYKERHMAVLDCQSCHSHTLHGPAFRTVDTTVPDRKGNVRIEYRNAKEKRENAPIGTLFVEAYSPFLLPCRVSSKKDSVSPFNAVTYWYWIDGKGKEISAERVAGLITKGGRFRPEIIKALDSNEDGALSSGERLLDTEKKVRAVASLLEKGGIAAPGIRGEVRFKKVLHNVLDHKMMTRDCGGCHASSSRFSNDIVLSKKAPFGVSPEIQKGPVYVKGEIQSREAGFVLMRDNTIKGRYVFGQSRVYWLDILGMLAVLGSFFGIALHGTVRYINSRKIPPNEHKTRTIYLYEAYERIWHWLMAAGIIILMITGLEIHYSGSFNILGLENAVWVHNIIAGVIVVNAFLSLFYHVTTGEIMQFFRVSGSFLKETIAQGQYYLQGIFKREPHPVEKTRERKLNPLQQITYAGLLNVLFPFQIITGILIWGAQRWPELSNMLGGLTVLGPLHNFGSWMFIAFLVVHLYLITTGHTVFSNLKAMVTGYDEVEEYHE